MDVCVEIVVARLLSTVLPHKLEADFSWYVNK